MIKKLSLDRLEVIIKQLAVKSIKRDNDSVTFKYLDKDGDEITTIISLYDEEKASATLIIPLPKEYFVTGMIVSNLYNNHKDAHGTFAYCLKSNEDAFVALECHISTKDGVSKNHLKQQLQTFIEQINKFEKVIIEGIKNIGPDSSFLKGSSVEGFWHAVGEFTGGLLSVITYNPQLS